MALVSCPEILLPNPDTWQQSSYAAKTIDAATEKYAVIFQAPKTGNVAKIGFRTMTVSTDAATRLKISLQALDGSGNPDGTILPVGLNTAKFDFTAAPASATAYTATIDTALAVTMGTIYAVVIEYGTFVASDSVQIASGWRTERLPYGDLYTGTWAKNDDNQNIWVEYDDGTYANMPLIPAVTTTTIFATTATNPDEVGLSFIVPFPCRISGGWVERIGAAGADFDMILYSGTTALQTISFDGDHTQIGGTDKFFYFRFATQQTITANTTYRLIVKPTTTTTSGILTTCTMPNANAIGQILGVTAAWVYTYRVDAGAWTDSTTFVVPRMGIMIDQLDDGVQTGGGGGAGFFTMG